jgi:hypothetical protein
MARLTEVEKELICTMCNIAESNGELAEMNDGRGDGDYEGWTRADFGRAERIFKKLFDPVAFAKKLASQDAKGD